MELERRIFIKWAIVTVVCGAHSFFWGYTIGHAPVAMLVGMLTIMLLFAALESHPYYQKRKNADALLARAVRIGLWVRIIWALLIPLGLGVEAVVFTGNFMTAPMTAELMIGMAASWICAPLFGGVEPATVLQQGPFLETYAMSVVTGLLHSLIFGILCLVAWGVLRLRRRCCARKTAALPAVES